MQIFRSFFFLIFILSAGSAVLAAEAPKSKLEELFIWKMSDELALKSEEEKQFAEMVRDLDQRKFDLNQQMQTHLEKMTSAKTEKEKANELAQYKKSLQSYNRISEEEIDRVQKILGTARTVQYLQAKKDLTNRLKSLLANPDTSTGGNGTNSSPAPETTRTKKPLPSPKVIEQK